MHEISLTKTKTLYIV